MPGGWPSAIRHAVNRLTRFPVVELDAQLITRAARGDMRAYEALYRHHVGRVYGLCLRMTGDVSTAEECTQDAFVRAWHKLDSFQGRSRFSTWLHRIAVNSVLDKRRDRETSVGEAEAAAEAADLEQAIDLDDAIRRLPGGARDVFVLHVIYGYTHDQVAELLGLAPGTCKAQLHRARKLLRERLGE